MKKPRLLNLAAGVSLLLAIAIIVLWVRSYYPVSDYIAWRGHTTLMAHSRGGRLWLQMWKDADPLPILPASTDIQWTLRGTTNPPYQPTTPINVGRTPPPFLLSNFFGFDWDYDDFGRLAGKSLGTRRMLAVPDWSVLLAAILLPAACVVGRLRHRRAARRIQQGRCPTCGYDLRAHSAGDRCPECGAVAEMQKSEC